MTKHSISTTITKLYGPEADEYEVPVCVTASITPADPSVGIMSPGWEDLEITNDDGMEISVSEAEENRLGQELVKDYLASPERNYRGAPHEEYS